MPHMTSLKIENKSIKDLVAANLLWGYRIDSYSEPAALCPCWVPMQVLRVSSFLEKAK
jgi:hypothetical protein